MKPLSKRKRLVECVICKEEVPWERAKRGANTCDKTCENESYLRRGRLYYQRGKKEILVKRKKHYQENRELFKKKNAEYREKHKERLDARRRRNYYAVPLEERRRKKDAWYQLNKDRINLRAKQRRAHVKAVFELLKDIIPTIGELQ